MSKSQRKREQKSKSLRNMGNRPMYDAMQEIRRSSATEPHRDRTKYDRRDNRAVRQSGDYSRWEA